MDRKHLTLVGAGPGDPELITMKGVRALADADVVLFDALVHPDLLDFIPESVEKIFVGKQKGVCQFKQEDIHSLIVEHALKNKHVVRLKGGDSFIFGRGHEEKVYAESFDIPVSVIPGISSAYSVPEMQGIPLTRRGFSESFFVVTGTTKNHELSDDIIKAANTSATIVILMGMHKLPQIVDVFQCLGKGEIPVAIIQNGSRDNEKIGFGNIDSIVDVVAKEELGSPAIIVVGEVVKLHDSFQKVLKEVARK